VSCLIAEALGCSITARAGDYSFAFVGHHSPTARLAKVEAILEHASRVFFSQFTLSNALCLLLFYPV